jgi:hypothetical protein
MNYRPVITKDGLETIPEWPVFKHGHLIQNGDLDAVFLNSEKNHFSPYSISYAVGAMSDDGNFRGIGSSERIPVEMRTGRYRPNFQIGDTWFTGSYEIRWTLVVNNGDESITRSVPFTVASGGINNVSASTLGTYDLGAAVFIIE